LRSASVEPGVHPVSVEFDFVQPVRAIRCLFDELRELRFDPGRWRREPSFSPRWDHRCRSCANGFRHGGHTLALLEWPNLMRMCQDLCAATRFVGLRRSLARYVHFHDLGRCTDALPRTSQLGWNPRPSKRIPSPRRDRAPLPLAFGGHSAASRTASSIAWTSVITSAGMADHNHRNAQTTGGSGLRASASRRTAGT
jgi:hypothetical protein